MPGAAGRCILLGLGCSHVAALAGTASRRPTASKHRACFRQLRCGGSREPYETSRVPYYIKSKADALRREVLDYVKTLGRQADSITAMFAPASEDDARDMVLMGISFIALVWLSMELVRLYLYWHDMMGFKTIAQLLHKM